MKLPARRLNVLLFSTLIVAWTSVSAQAAILIVTNTNDSGAGSLRDTIAATTAGDTVQFDPALNGQAIMLTSAELQITKSINIEGPGASQLTVRRSDAAGTPAFRIFMIAGVYDPVTIAGLTISNGNDPGPGGGILIGAHRVTLTRCIISGNSAPNGGGIFCGGANYETPTVTITNCTISGNSATYGGGMFVEGPSYYGYHGSNVTITNSSIADNGATSSGGGVANYGTSTIANSTVSTNVATADESGGGGGILNTGTLILLNSSISGNSASLGGGIKDASYFPFNDGPSTTTNSTISGNSAGAGGGIYTFDSPARRSRSSLIASNTSPDGPDVHGQLISEGFNLIGNNAGLNIAAQPSDLIGTPASPIDPLLGALQNNGGPTLSHALLPGSPAIDQGESSGSGIDQRHFHRPQDLSDVANAHGGDGADIGAVESAPATLANISTRLRVGGGDNAMIGGFIITGTEAKTVIVRGLGPSLPLPGALADPVIEVHGPAGQLIAANDNWRDAATHQEIIDSGLSPTNDLESSLWARLDPGAYTVVVRDTNNAAGAALFEVYDLDQSVNSKPANISTRGFVATGDDVMIGGIIMIGSGPTTVLLRAIGPSLSGSGVPNPLADPVLELYDGNGGLIAINYDWRDTQEAEISATGIPPTSDLESAMVRDIPPGNYTAIVHGLNNTTGVALVEIYNLN